MKTELVIYKPNLVKNFNFKSKNYIDNSEGTGQTNIWADNGTWTIYSGYATTINTNGNSLAQGSLFEYYKDYTVTINVTTVTGNLYVYVGVNAYTITTPGLYTFNLNSGNGDDLEIFGDVGINATVNWIKITEANHIYNLDLTNDNVTIPITYNIADIRDISKRNASFSKTIIIPGNDENNIVFNHIYEISGDCDYNPNKKVKAILYYNDEVILSGYMQLKNINRKQNGLSNYDLVSYEIVLTGGVTDLFTDMGTTTLNELGWSEYDHTYTVSNQINSWSTSIIKNGTTFNNFTNGANRTLSSVQIAGDGRAQINFTSAHGFSVNDQIYINITGSGDQRGYEGDQRVFSIVSSTSIKIYYPYINNTSTLVGVAYKHNPIGDGYVYPQVYYGTHNDGTAMSGTDWRVTDHTPGIYLKTYIDKIQKYFGYTFDSTLFNNPEFKRLIMLNATKDFGPSNQQLNSRAFQATKTNGYSGSYDLNITNIVTAGFGNLTHDNTPTSRNWQFVYQDDFNAPNFDNGSDYNNSTGRWIAPVTGTYTLTMSLTLKVDMTIVNTCSTYTSSGSGSSFTACGIKPIGSSSGSGNDFTRLTFQVIDYTTNAIISTTNVEYHIANGGIYPVYTSFEEQRIATTNPFTGIAGHSYGVLISLRDIVDCAALIPYPLPLPFPKIHIDWQIKAGAMFYNTPIRKNYLDGDSVQLETAIPNMTCQNFMLSLIKMFNLYIETSKTDDRRLLMETRNEYYNTTAVEDWTELLDLNNDIVLQPMAELNAKTYEYKFKEDSAQLNDDHLKNSGIGYGDKRLNIDSDFLSNTSTVQVDNSAGVLCEFPPTSNRVITGIYADDNGTKSRIEGNPRILYFGVASSNGSTIPTYNYNTVLPGSTSASIYVPGSDSVNNLTTYCYAGHLDKVRGPRYDYNFGYPVRVNYNYNQWTSANLFNMYYRDMLNEITSKTNKLITCNLYLKSSHISKLNFRARYIIDGHYLRLNKVIEFVPGIINSVKCEFIKIEDNRRYTTTSLPYYNGPRMEAVNLDGDKLPIYTDGSGSANGSYAHPTILVNGLNNSVNETAVDIMINGDNNTVGAYAKNITIQNSNNVFVYGGLDNVTIINTSNAVIKESGVTVINGLTISKTGAILNTNINYIDAGCDNVLYPFNNNTIINYIDAGKDNVLSLGSNSLINSIDGGTDVVL